MLLSSPDKKKFSCFKLELHPHDKREDNLKSCKHVMIVKHLILPEARCHIKNRLKFLVTICLLPIFFLSNNEKIPIRNVDANIKTAK